MVPRAGWTGHWRILGSREPLVSFPIPLTARPGELSVEHALLFGPFLRLSKRILWQALALFRGLGLSFRHLLPGPAQHVVAHHLRVL